MSKIRGIGVDLCEINRMQAQLQNHHLLDRILTPQEQTYVAGRGAQAADSLAGLWAAKEAVVKALGCGIAFPLTEIEISHTQQGQPVCTLTGSALQRADGGELLLSITHEQQMAAAFCVWQTDE